MQTTQNSFPVILTDKACAAAMAAIEEMNGEEGNILRISVKGGGCAGMQYSLNFTNETDPLDLTIIQNGLTVAADVFSGTHLDGTVVDYVETEQGAGFRFENPNAKRTCGCGSSFSG